MLGGHLTYVSVESLIMESNWKLEYRKGCLVEAFTNGDVDDIAHCANCFCRMGSGVAKAIVEAYPLAEDVDIMTKKGDRNKLGTISTARISGVGDIYNVYGQYNYGTNKIQVDYEALRVGLFKVVNRMAFKGLTLGVPKLGCGLAGGDWKIVEKILEELSFAHHVKVVVYEL
jgi:O-acetyl-ADP-ribose deacetylase (regulator of RNase III)